MHAWTRPLDRFSMHAGLHQSADSPEWYKAPFTLRRILHAVWTGLKTAVPAGTVMWRCRSHTPPLLVRPPNFTEFIWCRHRHSATVFVAFTFQGPPSGTHSHKTYEAVTFPGNSSSMVVWACLCVGGASENFLLKTRYINSLFDLIWFDISITLKLCLYSEIFSIKGWRDL